MLHHDRALAAPHIKPPTLILLLLLLLVVVAAIPAKQPCQPSHADSGAVGLL